MDRNRSSVRRPSAFVAVIALTALGQVHCGSDAANWPQTPISKPSPGPCVVICSD